MSLLIDGKVQLKFANLAALREGLVLLELIRTEGDKINHLQSRKDDGR